MNLLVDAPLMTQHHKVNWLFEFKANKYLVRFLNAVATSKNIKCNSN